MGESTEGCTGDCVAGVGLEGRSESRESVIVGVRTVGCTADSMGFEERSESRESVVVGGRTVGCAADSVALEGRSGSRESAVVMGLDGCVADFVPGMELRGPPLIEILAPFFAGVLSAARILQLFTIIMCVTTITT